MINNLKYKYIKKKICGQQKTKIKKEKSNGRFFALSQMDRVKVLMRLIAVEISQA